jgi:hypothetical protein
MVENVGTPVRGKKGLARFFCYRLQKRKNINHRTNVSTE